MAIKIHSLNAFFIKGIEALLAPPKKSKTQGGYLNVVIHDLLNPSLVKSDPIEMNDRNCVIFFSDNMKIHYKSEGSISKPPVLSVKSSVLEIQQQLMMILNGQPSIAIKTIELTKREEQVFACIRRGVSDRDISSLFGCSYKTVSSHKCNLLRKMGIKSKVEIVSFCNQLNVLEKISHNYVSV